MAFLGPSEQWPEHSRPLARAALKSARSAGWYFRECNGHTFGILKCADSDTACAMPVWSTSGSADGADTAKAIRQVIRKCPHQTSPESGAELADEDTYSDSETAASVARLLEAVNALACRQDAEAAMTRAAEDGDEEEFDRSDARRAEADNSAALAFHGLGKGVTPWPPSVSIDELLREAEALASSVRDPELSETLRQRVRGSRPVVI